MPEEPSWKSAANLAIGGVVGLGVLGFLVFRLDDPMSDSRVMLGLLGGLGGWFAGIFVKPRPDGTPGLFYELRAGLATFFGGVSLSEVRSSVAANSISLEEVAYCLIPGGIAFLFTWYGGAKHSRPPLHRPTAE